MHAFRHLMPHLSRARLLAAPAAAVVGLTAVSASPAARTALPNPCTVLSSIHSYTMLGHGAREVGKTGPLKTYGSGKYQSVSCSDVVGPITVYLSLMANGTGGFGGVRVTSTTHPEGFGGTGTLIVGTGAGGGGPVDFMVFHRGTTYVDLSANGATPAGLTLLGQSLYKLI